MELTELEHTANEEARHGNREALETAQARIAELEKARARIAELEDKVAEYEHRLRDGRPVPAIGEKLVHKGPVEICCSGLHASLHPFDALRCAPGPMLHKVECSEPIESHWDKFVCRERTILATIDATYLLRRFAADQALSVAHLWDMPDVVRDYLETLDERKQAAARDAAVAAARDARDARAAAESAVRAAAGDAARADFKRRVDEAFEEAGGEW